MAYALVLFNFFCQCQQMTDFWTLIRWSSKRKLKLKVNPMATFEIFLSPGLALFNNKKLWTKQYGARKKSRRRRVAMTREKFK